MVMLLNFSLALVQHVLPIIQFIIKQTFAQNVHEEVASDITRQPIIIKCP